VSVQTAEDIGTISIPTAAPCLCMPDHDKIWLTSMDPFLPKFCPKWPTPADLSVGDIRRQIAAEWLETEMHRARPTSRPVLHHLVNSEYDRRYQPSDGAFCQITLATVSA